MTAEVGFVLEDDAGVGVDDDDDADVLGIGVVVVVSELFLFDEFM